MLRADGKHYEAQELPTLLFGQKKPLSYVLNPKAACTLALNFVFFLNYGYRYFDPIQIHYSRLALLQLNNSALDPRAVNTFCHLSPESFSIVRDPLQRFVSGFLSKVLSDEDPYYRAYRDMLTSVHGIDLSPEADSARSCLAFANWIASHADQQNVDRHFRPQFLNLQIGSRFVVDTILRLEDRGAILAFFSRWIGAEKAKWFLSLQFNAHTKYAKDDVITDELKMLVQKIYAKDYELFYSRTEVSAA